MTDDEDTDPLAKCIETVHRLEEENTELRKAAGAFGQLAERLNQTLQEERRQRGERRQETRPSDDRRAQSH
jgi:hypothetical protein